MGLRGGQNTRFVLPLLIAFVVFLLHPAFVNASKNNAQKTQIETTNASQKVHIVVQGFIDRLMALTKTADIPDETNLDAYMGLFQNFTDTKIIARAVLGVDARRATPKQIQDFTKALELYLARKYRIQFQRLKNGTLAIETTKKIRSFYETTVIMRYPNADPIKIVFLASDKSGEFLIFDIHVAGISLLKATRVEIGALLDSQSGNIDKLINVLENN